MKKLAKTLGLIVLALALAFVVLTACNTAKPVVDDGGDDNNVTDNGGENQTPTPVALPAPIGLAVSGTTLSWTAVSNASSYSISFSAGTASVTVASSGASFDLPTLSGLTVPPDVTVILIKVKAIGNGTTYTDSPWSAEYQYNVSPHTPPVVVVTPPTPPALAEDEVAQFVIRLVEAQNYTHDVNGELFGLFDGIACLLYDNYFGDKETGLLIVGDAFLIQDGDKWYEQEASYTASIYYEHILAVLQGLEFTCDPENDGQYIAQIEREEGRALVTFECLEDGGFRLTINENDGKWISTIYNFGETEVWQPDPNDIVYMSRLPRLDTPEHWIEGMTIFWDEIENAVGYRFQIMTSLGDNRWIVTDEEVQDTSYTLGPEYANRPLKLLIIALGDWENYQDSYPSQRAAFGVPCSVARS